MAAVNICSDFGAPPPPQKKSLLLFLLFPYLFAIRFQGKLFNIMVIQVYTPTSNDEEAEV